MFCKRFCRAFLSILITKAYQHTLFCRVTGHFLSWCKYAPFLCSFTSMPFWSNHYFFFLGNFANFLFSGILQCHGGLFQCSIQCINWYPFTNKTVVFHISCLVLLSSYYSIYLLYKKGNDQLSSHHKMNAKCLTGSVYRCFCLRHLKCVCTCCMSYT